VESPDPKPVRAKTGERHRSSCLIVANIFFGVDNFAGISRGMVVIVFVVVVIGMQPEQGAGQQAGNKGCKRLGLVDRYVVSCWGVG
jgi:hypothetical protein